MPTNSPVKGLILHTYTNVLGLSPPICLMGCGVTVVSGFDHPQLLWLLDKGEPLFVVHHMVWSSRVHVPNFLQLWVGHSHSVGFMLHDEGQFWLRCLWASTKCDQWRLSISFRLDPALSVSTLCLQNSLSLWGFRPQNQQSVMAFPCQLLVLPWLPLFMEGLVLLCFWFCSCGRLHWNYCQHHPCASISALVGRFHCVPIHLVCHDQEASPPSCTSSCCQCAYSLTHPGGFPLLGASTVGRKTRVYSPLYRPQSGMLRTLTSGP